MKNSPLIILALALIILGANVLSAKAEEKPVPAGSIQPSGEIAKKDLPSYAKIDFAKALRAALKAVPGSAILGELEVEDGTLVYSFLIVDDEKEITEVEVDAGNGKVLAKEEENDEDVDKK